MVNLVSDNIDEIYLDLLHGLKLSPKVGDTRETNNISVCLTNIENNIVSIRDISVPYMFAELMWYFAGRNDVKFIGSFASLWKRISDDGITNNSAYGYLIKEAFGFNQVEKTIELLKKDPLSRRAVINLNTPNERVIETKDEPCTIAIQFLLRRGKLNCTVMMRSNDIWFGFPYDVIFFTELQKYIANRLEVGYGTYTHFVGSMHLYDRDYDKVGNILMNRKSKPIYYNRANFFASYETIINQVLKSIDNGENAKETLLGLLEEYNIYKEIKDED